VTKRYRQANRRGGRRPSHAPAPGRPAHDTVIPPEALAQRARIVGEAAQLDHRSGTALGQLLHGGYIDERLHDAGVKAGMVWAKWQRLAACPPISITGRSQGQSATDDTEEWRRAKEDFNAMATIIRAQPAGKLAWDAVETVCLGAVDFRENPVMLQRWPVWGEHFKGALIDLARLWKIGGKTAA